MKKVYLIGFLCLIMLSAIGCTSTTTNPYFYSNNENTNFDILGEIIYESADRVGYIELLRAARKMYPDCDYILDIMIDERRVTTTFFWFVSIKSSWIMRGTAIKYRIK